MSNNTKSWIYFKGSVILIKTKPIQLDKNISDDIVKSLQSQ